MNTKIINIFGGPGVGKSTLAADIFTYYKKQFINIELVREYAKDLTWEERHNILEKDQIYIFAKQHRIIARLIDKVDYIVTDSPLLLSAIYLNEETTIYNPAIFYDLVHDTFNKYNNINILLKRNTNFKYEESGRNQNLEGAIEFDNKIKNFLDKNKVYYDTVQVGEDTLKTTLPFLKYQHVT